VVSFLSWNDHGPRVLVVNPVEVHMIVKAARYLAHFELVLVQEMEGVELIFTSVLINWHAFRQVESLPRLLLERDLEVTNNVEENIITPSRDLNTFQLMNLGLGAEGRGESGDSIAHCN
jgi:hypothetical protein